MNPMDLENTMPTKLLVVLSGLADKEAMCKQVRGEQDVCAMWKKQEKSCLTEIRSDCIY